MAVPQRVEERLDLLEGRMTAVEALPARMDRLESRIDRLGTQLSERIDDARRETRVLHEDVLARLAIIGEGLVSQDTKIEALSRSIDASRSETRELFEQLLSRIEARRTPRQPKRR